MKASTVIAVATTLAASLVSAQLSALPTCAVTCAITSLGSTGCAETDVACICKATAFITALTPCVQAACSAADLQKTIAAAEGLCAQAGVSLSLPPVAASSTAAPVSTSTSVTVATSSAVVTLSTTTTSSVVVVPIPSSYAGSNTTTTAVIVSPTASSNVTLTSALPTASQTGAAGRNSAAIGSLGAVLAFAVALL